MQKMMNTLLSLYEHGGDHFYAGESVTHLMHAWQCGRLAEKSGANPALQLASWLHDVGHLWVDLEGTPTLRGQDDVHESIGAQVLLLSWPCTTIDLDAPHPISPENVL
jgi:predicted HD phosphohydrolase